MVKSSQLLHFNSIKKKLIFFMTVIGIFSVIAGVVSSALYSMGDARESITRKMKTTTEIVGGMSEGALLFDDEAVAREALSVLKNEPEIFLACLYKADDTVLGKYVSRALLRNAPQECPATADASIANAYGKQAYRFEHLIRDANGEKAGTIVVFAYLATLQDFISKQIWMTFVIVVVVSLMALGTSYILQPLITGPILSLVGLTRRISEEKDYSLRAATNSGDEVGALSASFNHMLATIQEREKELYEINEKAEAANRSKSQFLANMSHEIRTPINGILGFAQLLSVMNLDDKQRSFVDIILSSGNTLLTVINDILDFSKIEAGKLHIEAVPFDLSRTLESVVDTVVARAEEKGLDLILRYAPGTPTYVIGDPGRVRQVLLNFISNAIKFTEKGHVMLNAEARILGNTETIIRFEVNDTGIGIPKDAQRKIFEKFIQADASTTKRYGGTGLGLAISQQLAQLMGGEVGVSSEPGKGSTFWFEVPFRLDQAQPQNYNLPKIDLSGCHLLIVDDHELNRRILLELAQDWKIRAQAAESGEEALHLMKRAKEAGEPFHIAILDYQLPNMDGEDLSNLIKTDTDLAGISLILLTSMGMRGDAGKFQEIGFEAYLVKPARAAVLLDTVSTVWMNRNSGSERDEIITQHTFSRKINRRDIEDGSQQDRQLEGAVTYQLTPYAPQPADQAREAGAPEAAADYAPPAPVQQDVAQQDAAPQQQPSQTAYPAPEPSPPPVAPQPPSPAVVPTGQPQAVAAPPPSTFAAPPVGQQDTPPAPPPAPAASPRTTFQAVPPSKPAPEPAPIPWPEPRPTPAAQQAAPVPPPQPPTAVHEVEKRPLFRPVPLTENGYSAAGRGVAEPVAPRARILVVEDQLTNRMVIETVLNNMQLDSDYAENGLEAVQKAATQHFNLILMDVQMPIMNGFDATREIRKIETRDGKQRIPIVAVTANAMQGDREKCIEAGMDNYLAKPIQINELQQLVLSYVQEQA